MSISNFNVTDYVFAPPAGALSWFYVGDFGAVGDDIIDDSGSINRAIAAAASNGGGTVLLGPYTYNIVANPVTIDAQNVNLQGMGQGTSTLSQGFNTNPSNFTVVYLTPASGSNTLSDFTVQGPGNSATGSVPGPSTSQAPQLGSGWGIMALGTNSNLFTNITTQGCYHGFGLIICRSSHILQCTSGMGGQQLNPQFGALIMGPLGSASLGTIVLSGTPTAGDTLTGTFNDGQGNTIVVPAYTLTAGDQAGGLSHTALSFTAWLNNSDIVSGPNANWNNCSANSPSTGDIGLSIDVPFGANTPTYQVVATGVINASPSSFTPVAGGTRNKDPRSIVNGVSNFTTPQASLNGNASTESVRIEGGTGSIGVQNVGSTGANYTVRLVNALSGSDADPKSVYIDNISGDHTRVSCVSIENGSDVNMSDVHVIAGFGGGPPVVNFDINIGPSVGTWNLTNPRCSTSQGGGIGVATGSGTITNPRISKVGKNSLSCINAYGTQNIVGLTIKGGKLGAQDLSTGGQGGNSYGIDFAGPSAVPFTGLLQSVTIEDVDITGNAGAINWGTTLANSLAAFGLQTYVTAKDCAGYNPPLVFSDPAVPAAGASPLPTNAALNPYACDCTVLIVPDGTNPITSVIIYSNDGSITKAVNLTTPFSVQVPANCAILPIYTVSTTTKWYWFPS